MRRKATRENNRELWERVKQLRRETKYLIRAKFNSYIEKLTSTASNNINKIWSFFKAKSNKGSIPDTVELGDIKYDTPLRKAEVFNQFFASTFRQPSLATAVPAVEPFTTATLSHVELSLSDVLSNLVALDVSKAAGPDGIPSRLLRECAIQIAPSLTRLFNLSLSCGKFPVGWKEANVTPIFKKDSKKLVSNYRPISLLPIVSKVLEKCVLRNILPYFLRVISDSQFGFLEGRSCVSQLLSVLHEIGALLDKNTETDILYLDFAKAFDSINHNKLLTKLRLFGVDGPLWGWFADYLSNRRQRVVIDGSNSSWTPVVSGVPQGSILGPLLFLLYVNDLPSVTSPGTRSVLFADDTKCYRPQKSQQDHLALQYDLNGLVSWSVDWDLTFNASKCEVLKISRKRNPPTRLYNIGYDALKESRSQKDLGITISNNLAWHSHVVSVVAKSNKVLGFLRRNTPNSLGEDLRRKLYLSLVRSILCYGSQVWAPQSSSRDLLLLERIQRRATKFILWYYADLSYKDRLVKLNLLPLSYWFEYLDLLYFFKCRIKLYNIDVSSYVTPCSLSFRSTRSTTSSDYRPNSCKTSTYRDSYFNRIVLLWNSLPSNIKACTSVSSFKTLLRAHYYALLLSTFDPDRIRTYKTICSKCRSNTLTTVCCR